MRTSNGPGESFTNFLFFFLLQKAESKKEKKNRKKRLKKKAATASTNLRASDGGCGLMKREKVEGLDGRKQLGSLQECLSHG